MDPLAPGKDVGKYRVVRRLAVGGMAEIYLAQSRGIEGFEKYVVLKRILPQYAASATFVKLFLNEARVAASIDHPNIASVYDIGEVDGTYFFTMEYLHGQDLGHVLRAVVGQQQRIPLEHALTIGAGVAAGLHAAHEKRGLDGRPQGIVHRDVSPSNVVVTYNGGVKLVDFGVAKVTAAAELTGSGTLKGKLAYMSPEQCNEQPLDRRSDVFSLGVLLYELTTQTRLFKADSEAGTLRLVLESQVPPPSSRLPGYPPELEAIVLKALARDRERRFATTRELQVALEAVARVRGLVTSTAGLGDWLGSVCGEPPDPWMTPPPAPLEELELEPDDEPELRVGVSPSTPPRILRGPVLPTLNTDQPVVVDGTPAPMPRPRRWPLPAGIAAVTLAAVGLALWSGRRPPITPATEAAALAVPAPAPVALVPPPVVAQPPPTPPLPPAPGAVTSAPAPERPPPPASRRPAVRTPPGERAVLAARARTRAFTAAFARKEPQLLRCFADHAEAAAHAPQLFVRFQTDTDGHVTSAEVLPAELAGAPLGACVAKVAAGTAFGPQPAPVAFRIPVSARRVNGAVPR